MIISPAYAVDESFKMLKQTDNIIGIRLSCQFMMWISCTDHALIPVLDLFGNVTAVIRVAVAFLSGNGTTFMHAAMTSFSKNGTALCVHILNATAKFDWLPKKSFVLAHPHLPFCCLIVLKQAELHSIIPLLQDYFWMVAACNLVQFLKSTTFYSALVKSCYLDVAACWALPAAKTMHPLHFGPREA